MAALTLGSTLGLSWIEESCLFNVGFCFDLALER
jgi:hypothetical protein